MPINKLFGGSVELNAKALDIRLFKQGLIQSNIANISTPGYTVQDFSFKKAMEHAVANQSPLQTTHANHIGIDAVTAAEHISFKSEDRPVDLDEEMQKLSENQLMYQLATKLMAKKFDGMIFAIDEGGK